ncbi:MAG TPA: hypothetical protein VK629_17120 [Steroidobacteraceae bacterium]|nr:hypothetical protein [Steroidobacteraceae bacterium]
MKTKVATTLVTSMAAALAFTSFAASAVETSSIQACMESFAEQSFPGRIVSYRVTADRSAMQPLIATTGTQSVAVTATDTLTGRVIGTATCKVKELGRQGSVVVGTVESDQ